jgi:hypothetical protein
VVPEAVKDAMLIGTHDTIPILVSSSFERTVALAGLTNALLSGQEYTMAQTSPPASWMPATASEAATSRDCRHETHDHAFLQSGLGSVL